MGQFTSGKFAKGICDRCGQRYYLNALKLEWTGLKVCKTCLDPKDPLEFPTNFPIDPEALENPRPDSDVESGDGRVYQASSGKVGGQLTGMALEFTLGSLTLSSDTAMSANVLIPYTDFNSGSWVAINATVVVGAEDPDGGTTAYTMTDATAVAVGNIFYSPLPTTISKTQTATILVKKDSIDWTTRFPTFRLQYQGSTQERNEVFLNTSTGEYGTNLESTDTFATVTSYSSTYWLISIKARSTDQSNTQALFQILPCFGQYDGSFPGVSSLTGSIIAISPSITER
jgi:hypothetical protein